MSELSKNGLGAEIKLTKDTKYTISFSGTEMCDVNTDEVVNTTCKTTITVKATETTNNDTTTRYYDLNSEGWRSFTNINLVSIDD